MSYLQMRRLVAIRRSLCRNISREAESAPNFAGPLLIGVGILSLASLARNPIVM